MALSQFCVIMGRASHCRRSWTAQEGVCWWPRSRKPRRSSTRSSRRLLSAELGAGCHEIPWNGRDERGRELASGIYVARLSVASGLSSLKLVSMR